MKILMCSDGSEQADHAIRLGAQIAAGCQAEVTLLGIIEAQGESSLILERLTRAQALLRDRKIRAELITRAGGAVEEIVLRTRETPYDLVIVGAVQKTTRGLFWMSSKSYKIIKAVQPPVLTVAGKATTIRNVLICSGGRRYIDGAVSLAAQIARGVGAKAWLLHVMPELPAIYAGLRRMEENLDRLLRSDSELGINLRREKEILETQGVPTDIRLRHGSVLSEILREIREGDYDLVVTGSALSRGLRSYVLGDISREIVNQTRCAVLVARSIGAPNDHPSRFLGWWEGVRLG
jgi:nucleotide-binding universal stress UspA family protein